MTIEELERLIEGQSENPNLDFKADMPWSAKSLAKDILAMSNIRSGGTIVIGVAEIDDTFVSTGVCLENLQTYKTDQMKDDMTKYADPFVSFDVNKPSDKKGKQYVVIKVQQFSDVPVISKIDNGDVKKGRLYYRSRHRRIESAAISNSTDLRDLLDLAVVQLMRHRADAGYAVAPTSLKEEPSDVKFGENISDVIYNAASNAKEMLEREISQLPEGDLQKKIKSKGFWEIRFVPLKPGTIKPLKRLIQIVEKSQVRLNWTFPNIPREGAVPSTDCYESEFEFGSRKEFWRVFRSEQFHFFGALVEDWLEGDHLRGSMSQEVEQHRHILIFTSVIHLITQTFSFLGNLASNGFYKDGVCVQMTLHNTINRQLYIDAPNRKSFDWPRKTKAPHIFLTKIFSDKEAIQNSLENSNEFILNFYESFDFHPSSESVKNDQLRFLNNQY